MAESSEASQAAERYAQAVFELAKDANALPAVERDFQLLTAALKESADLRAAAASPLIDPEEKGRALAAVAQRLGMSELGRNVVGVAARNGRGAALGQIAAAFAKRLALHKGMETAQIISAAPLSDADRAAILAGLSQAVGRQVDAEVSVDQSLLGGFIVRVGSRQFDASLKTKLAGLKLALKQAS